MTEVRDMNEFPEWLNRIRNQEWLSVVAYYHRGRRVNKEDWEEVDSIWQMWFENTGWLSPFALHLKLYCVCVFSSSDNHFSHSVMSDSFRPHGLQHARPPCPSPTPGVHPNSCPLSRWCHPAISSSAVPFFSCLQSFLVSGSFQMSQLFASGGPKYCNFSFNISPSVLIPLGWTGWISLHSKGLSRVFSNTTVQKHQFFGAQLSFFLVQLSYPYITTGKSIALTRQTFVGK